MSVADVLDAEAGLAQGAGGSAGGDQLDAKAGQDRAKFDQSGLVCDAEQGAANALFVLPAGVACACVTHPDVLLGGHPDLPGAGLSPKGQEDQRTDYNLRGQAVGDADGDAVR